MTAGQEQGGIPSDDAGLLRRSLDGMPSAGLITLNQDNMIIQASGPSLEKSPTLRPGVMLRDALEELTHVEMVDRLMIHREIATFPGAVGGPVYHWMIWGKPNSHGEMVLTYWDTDWNEVNNEARAAFTMAASHELRGPLTAIQGFAEILNMDADNLTPEQAEAAQIVEQTARHLTVLVQDVFDLSRNSFGQLRLDMAETDLQSVITAVVSSVRPVIEERAQELKFQIEENLPRLFTDESRTTQMITNLITNSSTHNPPGTKIEVNAKVVGEHVAVEVRDDGNGLPFDDPYDALRSFRQGPNTTVGDRTGSGIGLAITKQLVLLHRGKITVESDPGEGTRITLWFPVDYEAALTPAKPKVA